MSTSIFYLLKDTSGWYSDADVDSNLLKYDYM